MLFSWGNAKYARSVDAAWLAEGLQRFSEKVAHGFSSLSRLWRKRLGKSEFVAFQASARGGVVKVRVVKDRVFLSGKATTVAKGEVLVGE